MAERVRLGQLLVDAGILTPEELEVVLYRQKKDGRRLGTLLLEAKLVNETQLTQILSQQLNAPWVSLYHIDFSRQLLNLVPRDIAERYCLVPIYVRHVRNQGETLYVAMDDPTNEEALQAVREASGLPVRAMIAPPSDIRDAIRVYYQGGRAPQPATQAPAPKSAEPANVAPAQTAPIEPPPAQEPPDAEPLPLITKHERKPADPVEVTPLSEPVVERTRAPAVPPARQELKSIPVTFDDEGPDVPPAEIPPPKKPKRAMPKMMSLTLLDGTTISLPQPRRRRMKTTEDPEEAEPTSEELFTARDIVAALRAVCHGADAQDILGPNARWEAMFAALLSVLLRKHLIADWEFVEEYKKI